MALCSCSGLAASCGCIFLIIATLWGAHSFLNPRGLLIQNAAESVYRNYELSYPEHCPSFLKGAVTNEDLSVFLLCVHLSPKPSIAAGAWVWNESKTAKPSKAHLQCLGQERQGICHGIPNAALNPARIVNIRKGMVLNSASISNADDRWEWHGASHPYEASGFDSNVLKRILVGRRIFLIGDSLTRQRATAMQCEFRHLLGFSKAASLLMVNFCTAPKGEIKNIRRCLERASKSSFVVVNVGHHIEPGNLEFRGRPTFIWQKKYEETLASISKALMLLIEQQRLKPRQIFFRTTSVRHFQKGIGDWYTNFSNSGSVRPIQEAGWENFGGLQPAQPLQNILMIQHWAQTPFGILDTAPMTLSRADATYDGSHFCLPGPQGWWSKMFYKRIIDEVSAE